ncbi:MAG TPA: hypothetical protein VM557_00255 [Thermoanaerobaculia bacterium]|nr:hypothetical protein [Thermoanaerobaculia bacterium]
MKNEETKRPDEATEPRAKRTGREGVSPESQPAEFADDLRTNRFTPPPDPKKQADGEK